jgi:hypothetical protein
MGFPFEIESYSCNAFAANQELYIYDDVQGGDFWVKTYDSDALEYVNEMLPYEGYILQFPSAFKRERSYIRFSRKSIFAKLVGKRYYIYNPATTTRTLLTKTFARR